MTRHTFWLKFATTAGGVTLDAKLWDIEIDAATNVARLHHLATGTDHFREVTDSPLLIASAWEDLKAFARELGVAF